MVIANAPSDGVAQPALVFIPIATAVSLAVPVAIATAALEISIAVTPASLEDVAIALSFGCAIATALEAPGQARSRSSVDSATSLAVPLTAYEVSPVAAALLDYPQPEAGAKAVSQSLVPAVSSALLTASRESPQPSYDGDRVELPQAMSLARVGIPPILVWLTAYDISPVLRALLA